MAKVLNIEPQNELQDGIRIAKIQSIVVAKPLSKSFGGVPICTREGMVYNLRLNAVCIGNDCIPMTNIAGYQIAE